MDPAEKVRPENSVSGQKGYKFGQKIPDPARKGTNSAREFRILPERVQIRPEKSGSCQEGYKFGHKNLDPARKGPDSAVSSLMGFFCAWLWLQHHNIHGRPSLCYTILTPGPSCLTAVNTLQNTAV